MINLNTNHVYIMRIYFCNSIIISFCSSSFAFDITKAPFAESRLLGRWRGTAGGDERCHHDCVMRMIKRMSSFPISGRTRKSCYTFAAYNWWWWCDDEEMMMMMTIGEMCQKEEAFNWRALWNFECLASACNGNVVKYLEVKMGKWFDIKWILIWSLSRIGVGGVEW